MELSNKGIPDDIISSVIEELNPDDDEVALEILKKDIQNIQSMMRI